MGRGLICSPRGASAVGATPLFAAPELVISCSATDWLAELDGGPGGSDAAVDRLPGFMFTWWVTISRSKLARSREMRRLARSRERREWRR